MSANVGDSPRAVTRGESPKALPVRVDWVNFTLPRGEHGKVVREFMAFLGVSEAKDRAGGLHGYTLGTDLDGYAMVCSGGESQRGTILVSLNGQGCGRIASFGALRQYAESLGGRLTRVDVCCDDHDGNVLDVERGIAAWRDGAFTTQGRPPSASCHDDLGSGDGKTLSVGKRGSGKLFRLYEKGRQLGDRASRWVRAEVEWHAKDRVIPWEILTDPVRFLAGSFPFLGFLSFVQERIATAKRVSEISIEGLVRWVRLAAGRSVNALCRHFDGDLGALVVAVRREGFPKRLTVAWGELERLGAR